VKKKQLRCSSCAKRIRSHHPHVGLIDRESGAEISYHAHPTCQRRGMQEMASLLKRGKVYVLRYHHGSACPDEAPGFGCAGGCFDTPVAVAN
jgi:hypothetical protein